METRRNDSLRTTLSTQLQLASAIRTTRRTTRRGDLERLEGMTARKRFKEATRILRAAAVSL